MSTAIAKKGELPDAVRAIIESHEHLLSVMFPKINSPYYLPAIESAQSAKIHYQWMNGKRQFHIIAFNKDRASVACAQTILDYALNWKGTKVYSRGQLLTRIYQIKKVLQCYADASNSRDWRAHCFEVTEGDPTLDYATRRHMVRHGIREKRYTSPCKLITLYIKCDQDHPASIHDQIHAIAVERDCAWCPNFDEKNFKNIN